MIRLWLKALLASRSGRLAGAVLGVGLTVALIAAIGTFTVSASRSMTARAIAGLPVDWQVALPAGSNAAPVIAATRSAAAVSALAVVGYADASGFKATTSATEQTTGPGQVVGLPPGYAARFHGQIAPLLGSLDGVLLAQQTAANLHAGVGDTITIERPGLAPVSARVAGIVALPNADSMFQVPGLHGGAGPQAPPDNVVLLPMARFQDLFGTQPAGNQPAGGPGSARLQLHVRLDHNKLPAEPGAAFLAVTHAANNLSARTAGAAVVADNLSARLAGARSDALYARVLFLFLGAPGVALAVLFTLAVAASGAERRRREQGLLRTRGASVRQLLQVAAVEAGCIGLGGVAAGLLLAVLASLIWWSPAALAAAGWWMLAGALSGLALAAAAILLPAWRDAGTSTVAATRVPARPCPPLWQRLFADVVLLAIAGLVFWLTAAGGYQVVVAPEGVPQTSIHYESFLAPFFLWIGGALLGMRLARLALARGGRVLSPLLAPLAGALSPVVAASLSRQRQPIARGAALVALAFAFAASTSVFDSTYRGQSRVDAELTNGADVTVTGTTAAPAGSRLASLAALPGVVAAEPMQHRYAYVGADLQDIFGIDPTRIARATPMSDALFTGASARAMLARLAARPDGVLVSQETVNDFQLNPGDLLNLRLQGADHAFHVVPFHYVGIAREFPTAPHDSFLVANAAYIARATGVPGSEVVLLRTRPASATAVAAAARTVAAGMPGVAVTTLDQAQALISSSLTAVDLRGLTRLELGFAVLMIAGATGLLLALGLAERRRSFTILAALGARPWQMGAFVWSEAVPVVAFGAAAGLGLGFAVAWVLVRLLSGVFDPPPESLAVPWLYLLLTLVAAAACMAGAARFTLALARRPDPYALRRS